ncbi:MAG: hypothetical protein GY757_45310, partial [bacterium]|nr:hypothetical protein [bacterium]
SGGIAHNPIEKLNKKIDYLEEKAEQVWHLHKKGMDNLSIAGTLFNNDFAMRIFTGGHYSAINLVNSLLEREI